MARLRSAMLVESHYKGEAPPELVAWLQETFANKSLAGDARIAAAKSLSELAAAHECAIPATGTVGEEAKV